MIFIVSEPKKNRPDKNRLTTLTSKKIEMIAFFMFRLFENYDKYIYNNHRFLRSIPREGNPARSHLRFTIDDLRFGLRFLRYFRASEDNPRQAGRGLVPEKMLFRPIS